MTDKDDLMGAAGLSMRQIAEQEEEAARESRSDDDDDETSPRISVRERVIADTVGGPVKTEEWDFDIPSMVDKYLKDDETKVIPLRLHQARLILPAFAFGGGLGIAVGLNMAAYASGRAAPAIVHLIWLAWLVAAGWALWRYAIWRHTWFVITGHRLMLIETTNRLGRDVKMLDLEKVRGCRYTQDLSGRSTGYATFRFASIGTEHALSEVRFVPYPEWVYRKISELTLVSEQRRPIKRNRGGSA